MIQLRFKKELYAGEALDQALEAFAPHAELTRSESETEWLVELKAEADEALVANELENFALGLTIESRGGPN